MFHFFASSFGHDLGAVKPSAFPSRLAPRHCGQSCAKAQLARIMKAQVEMTPVVKLFFFHGDPIR